MHDLSPHDTGEPRQINPETPADYFEVLTRAVFNAGLSWRVVHTHWPAFDQALDGFDPHVIAGYDEQDVERLLANDDLIQSRGKLSAVPANARTFVGLADAHDGFTAWLDTFDDYDARERGLINAFKYVGEFGAYWSMYTWNGDVPDYKSWCEARGRPVPESLR